MLNSRIRIAHAITMLELGGAQQNTLYTVSHLDPNRFEAHLITGRGGMLDSEAEQMNAPVHFCDSLVRPLDPIADLRAFYELKALFRKIQPQIVHTHSSKAGVLGRLAAKAAGVPYIVHTYHGFGFHRFQNPLLFQLYLAAERAACRKTDHLIFVSEGNRDWAHQLHLTNGCSTSLIRSGVEVKRYRDSIRTNYIQQQFGTPDRAKIVGMIACLKPQKDPLTFVEAADLVMEKLPDAYFLLIGDGELRNKVNHRSNELKDPSRFIAAGWRRDVDQLLANMDLLVLTSLWEGLPRVIPEATISGIPVVASNIEGNREVIFEMKNGLLAEPRNSRDFAEKIVQALSGGWKVDTNLRDKMENQFSIEEMVTQQENLYLQLIKGGK